MKLSLKHMAKSTTLGDMSMNRSLLGWLVLKGALVGIIAGFFGATFRYMILESEHWRWTLLEGMTYQTAVFWILGMVVMALSSIDCWRGRHYLAVPASLKSKGK